MKDLAELKWVCPVCGHEDYFHVHRSDVRLIGKTNADHIQTVSVEELADYHTKMCGCPPGHDPIFCGMATIGCKGCWLSWLKAPVEEVQDG